MHAIHRAVYMEMVIQYHGKGKVERGPLLLESLAIEGCDRVMKQGVGARPLIRGRRCRNGV